MAKAQRSLQSHGQRSRVYVPIIRSIFTDKYVAGAASVDFTLDEIRQKAAELGIDARNPADVIYRMRSRTVLPKEVMDQGFRVLRQIGRGRYRLELAENTIFAIPDHPITEALDLTPLPVRRLLPKDISEIDEQGFLTMIGYCKLMDHFTGLTVYRLRSHVRKSVRTIGQAELDEIDVGIALRDDEIPVIFPIEAKAADEAVNRVQISTMVAYCDEHYCGYEIRPLAVKLDYEGIIHFLEFNPAKDPADLALLRSAGYRLKMSPQQAALFATAHRPDAVARPRDLFDGTGGG